MLKLTQEQFESVPEEERARVLMRAVLLDEDQIRRLDGLLEPLPEEELADRSDERYAADCGERRLSAALEFTATRTGFTARTNYAQEELVFFSVPCDDGFMATVNGQPADIEKVDNGLMAVRVPAGAADIVFTYHTPGLALSAGVSLAGLAVYAGYLLLLHFKRKRKQNADPC